MVRAWVGVVDGQLSWSIPYINGSSDEYRRNPWLCELFRTRKAAREIYEDVRRVTLRIYQP